MWISITDKSKYMDAIDFTGIRLRFYDGVDDNVKRACKEFCKWLRRKYWFPIRCTIHVYNEAYIENVGRKCSSVFYYSADEEKEIFPFIHLVTGNYRKNILKYGVDNVLASYLSDIAHELTHYFQWYFYELGSDHRTNRSIENEATRWANYILCEYKSIKKHP